MLKAYAIYAGKTPTPTPLLIADLKKEVINDYLKELHLESIQDLIYAPGYIANTDLPALYSTATAFIYTSLRESFGIPLLECMACGTPVITSNLSAIPEIAGKGAILVDPYQEEEIAAMLTRVEKDAAFRQEQITYGLQRVKAFSWKQTAQKVLNLYQNLTSCGTPHT